MYKEISCWNTGNTYRVTNTENIPVGVHFYTREDDGFYSPVIETIDFVADTYKPSVYHRPLFRCVSDEYKYKFSTKKVETKTTERDFYYNSRRNKYITRTHTNTKERRFISF